MTHIALLASCWPLWYGLTVICLRRVRNETRRSIMTTVFKLVDRVPERSSHVIVACRTTFFSTMPGSRRFARWLIARLVNLIAAPLRPHRDAWTLQSIGAR